MNLPPHEVALDKYARDVADEMAGAREDQASESTSLREDVALARVYLSRLEEEGIIGEVQLCAHTDETGRNRCAITAYSLPDGADRLDLFLSSARSQEGLQSISASELADMAGRAARFFDYASRQQLDRFNANPEALEAARLIHGSASRVSNVRVYLLTNARARERDIDSLEINKTPIAFEVIDLERLYRLSMAATSRQDIQIDFVALNGRPLACLEMTPRAREYDTYLAIFSGQLLCDLYERFGQRLFEFNVRSFLQAKGKVNKGIRETLRDEPDRFLAFNNGIVATADEIEVGLFCGEMAITRIVGLQVVNGAQTTASIHRAKKVDKIDLTRVAVAAKITKVAPEKLQVMVPLLSRFANTQNAIQVADLSANNDFHIEMERLADQTWCPGEESRWFYERARGAYQDALNREGSTAARRRVYQASVPPSQKFTKTDLAKYFMAWIGRPHIVCFGAQKNFAVFMSELDEFFTAGWKPNLDFYKRTVGQAILFRACERVSRAAKFPAYRANIVNYTYSYLSHASKGEFDFAGIWRAQTVSDELNAVLVRLVGHIDQVLRTSAGAKNVTEWCKKSECWDAVRSSAFSLPHPLPMEFVTASQADGRAAAAPDPSTGVAGANDVAKWEDEEQISECMRHDAAVWAKLNYWGISTGALDYYERGVSHTLSEYAASSWVRKPSVKQARIGARVLRRARDEKLI